MPRPAWSVEEYDRLRALAATGLTAVEIAKTLNKEFGNDRTRNAILGATHRIGVTVGTANTGSIKSAEVRLRKARGRPSPPKAFPKILQAKGERMPEPIIRRLKPKTGEPDKGPPWSVNELTPRVCRWIAGDPAASHPFECGEAKVFDKPYCASHMKRAFGPTPRPSSYARQA